MKLKFKSAEEFRSLLTALLDDLVDARFHFSLHQNLAKATEEYASELAQSPTFWGLTLSAHMDAVLLRLCRAYDTYKHDALNLRNLLDTIQAHLNIFDEPNFRERLKGNAFVDSLAAELKPLDQAQLQKDLEVVSDSDPLVHKLVMWRHSYIAHRNIHFTLNPKTFDAQYPLLFAEVDVLITRALEIGNRYSLLFDATAHATLMVGRDDYLNVLKAVREHVAAYERRLDEEWKQLGMHLPKNLRGGASTD
jgi:AbiU2